MTAIIIFALVWVFVLAGLVLDHFMSASTTIPASRVGESVRQAAVEKSQSEQGAIPNEAKP